MCFSKLIYSISVIVFNHLFIFGFTGKSIAQTTRYSIEHYGEEEGLPQNTINSILPDKNGFLWIATESGITRFNGNRFLPVSSKSGLVSNNFARIKDFYYKGNDTILAYSAASNQVAVIYNNKITAIEKPLYDKHGIFFFKQ